MEFTEFNLNKDLLKGISAAGFSQCTPVQELTIAEALNKKDVCVQSQTGTGKTAAFLIPVFQLLLEDKSFEGKKTIIVAPTRELAVQIEKEAKLIGKHLPFSIGCFYGGVGYAEQEKMLERGTDVIIGTPGRLIDFGGQDKIAFDKTGILIIDEADRLFDMGFLPDLQRMISDMPPAKERITMLFSATLNSRVRDLAWKYMNDPAEIEISPESVVVDKITQELYHVGKDEKIKLLLGILKKENPNNAIIFTNMKRTAEEVCKRLEINGIKCHYIMGDLPQNKRLAIIDKVKSGKIKFLVATEVAARGLHINDLDLVINYDLPEDCENYVHRIGRTARAGKSGKAISLACEKYVYGLQAIEAFTNFKIPVAWPDEGMFVEDKSAGMYISLEKDKNRKVRERKSSSSERGARGNARRESRQIRPSEKRKSARPEQKRTVHASVSAKEKHNTRSSKNIHKEQTKTVRRPETHAYIPENKKKSNIIISVLSSLGTIFRKKGVKKEKVKASKNGTVEERMAYYKKKYGANFIPSPELLEKETRKKIKHDL